MRVGEGTRVVTQTKGAVTPLKTESDEPSPFARVLRGLGKEVDNGEKLTKRAIEGGNKDLGPNELLALQAGVYRYSEAIDLSSKLIDRASSGVKTVLQGQ